ncbi:MAG: transposase [Candidatus Aminicenantes bacterium]|nr:transposase [Candidatus Aminicenantes bacterium]
MDSARIASKIRAQILQFSGELSRGFPKVLARFVAEMIYGIQARQSVRLTEVSRALAEPIPIKKTVERLSRQLRNPRLARWLTNRLLMRAAGRVRDLTLLILDLSDVHKKYAQKMEHLATVWDGSEKTKNRGYWTLNIVGAETGSAQILPLYGRLFSHTAPDFQSENIELREAIGKVSAKTQKRGIWVIDRGGDRGYLYRYLLHEGLRFIIRVRSDRTVLTDREESVLEAAQDCPMLFHEYIAREDGDGEKPRRLEVGYRRVRLPDHPDELGLVVVKGFGREPMMLLTNLRLKRSRKVIWHIVEAYLTRWRIEETIRFMKQSYQLEDIRVLKYSRLQNMMALLVAVLYFTAIYLGIKMKLRVLSKHLVRAARRVFGIPDFRLYALADGIKQVLFNRTRGPGTSPRQPPPSVFQRLLF